MPAGSYGGRAVAIGPAGSPRVLVMGGQAEPTARATAATWVSLVLLLLLLLMRRPLVLVLVLVVSCWSPAPAPVIHAVCGFCGRHRDHCRRSWLLDLGAESGWQAAAAAAAAGPGRVWPGAVSWLPGPSMRQARRFFTAVVAAGGRVVVAGGQSAAGLPLRAAEVYNPATGRWAALPPMATARFAHAAALLPDGRVGVFGTHTRSAARRAHRPSLFE